MESVLWLDNDSVPCFTLSFSTTRVRRNEGPHTPSPSAQSHHHHPCFLHASFHLYFRAASLCQFFNHSPTLSLYLSFIPAYFLTLNTHQRIPSFIFCSFHCLSSLTYFLLPSSILPLIPPFLFILHFIHLACRLLSVNSSSLRPSFLNRKIRVLPPTSTFTSIASCSQPSASNHCPQPGSSSSSSVIAFLGTLPPRLQNQSGTSMWSLHRVSSSDPKKTASEARSEIRQRSHFFPAPPPPVPLFTYFFFRARS